jgi:glycerophosphoryl diester phosphodiesterase
VWVYTFNDPDEAVWLAGIGVNGIITDDPALLRSALGVCRSRPSA